MVFPETPLPTVVELFVDGVWTDITEHTRGLPEFIDITRGRSNEAGQVEASRCSLMLNNRDGRFSPRNALSPLFGKIGRNTPLRVRVDADIRFTGEVPAWPQRWDKTGRDVWVPIEAAGILRRLGQGKPVPTSGLRSTILANEPRHYWPLDDAVGTSEGVDLGRIGSLFTTDTFRFKTYSEGTALAALREYGTGDLGDDMPAGLSVFDTSGAGLGYLYCSPVIAPSATAVAVDFVWRAEDRGRVFMAVQQFANPAGETYQYQVRMLDDNTLEVELVVFTTDTSSLTPLGTTAVLPELSDGARHHLRFSLTENLGDVDFEVFIDGASVGSDTVTDASVDGLARITFEYNLDEGVNTPLALGHVVPWETRGAVSIPDLAPLALAATQYDGERAGHRIVRLCAENDIPLTFGNINDTVALGPQTEDTLLDALRAAALADGGILFEPRDFLGLRYIARVDLYNQPAVLQLDYTDGVFAQIPEPVDDDQNTRNDVTVTRQSGGSANAVLEEGSLSVQDPPDGVGRYDTNVQISLAAEGELPNQASWRLSLGTVDEPRFPSLALGLHRTVFTSDAALTAAAAGLDLGGRVTIANMPDWVTRDLVSQMAQGFTERLSNFLWFIEVNASPESPFQVGEYETAAGGEHRYDTDGSEVFDATFDAGIDTGMSVEVSRGPLWTTDVNEFPFDIACSGVRLRVTAVTGASSPQNFTIQQTPVNGVEKAIPPGTPLSLWTKARYAL